MTAIEREDLANDPALTQTQGSGQQQLIDAAIGGWTSAHTSLEVIETLEQVDVPVGPSIPLKTPLMMRTTKPEACLKK